MDKKFVRTIELSSLWVLLILRRTKGSGLILRNKLLDFPISNDTKLHLEATRVIRV